MASTLRNFLIGVGFDYDDSGVKKAEGGMTSLRGHVLQAGAALAGAFGTRALTFGFARFNDEVGKFSQTFGVIPEDVTAFGRVLDHEAGSVQDFISGMQGLRTLQAGVEVGDVGFISELGRAGLNASAFTSALTPIELLLELANQFENLSANQRINAAGALGITPAFIRLLAKGSEGIQEAVAREKELSTTTAEATKVSSNFLDSYQDLNTTISHYSDRISTRLIPALTGVINDTVAWDQANRSVIDSGFDFVLDKISDNIGGITTSIGLLTGAGTLSVLGKVTGYLPGIGKPLSFIFQTLAKISALGGVAAGVATGLNAVIGEEAQTTTSKPVVGEEAQTTAERIIGAMYNAITFSESNAGVFTNLGSLERYRPEAIRSPLTSDLPPGVLAQPRETIRPTGTSDAPFDTNISRETSQRLEINVNLDKAPIAKIYSELHANGNDITLEEMRQV